MRTCRPVAYSSVCAIVAVAGCAGVGQSVPLASQNVPAVAAMAGPSSAGSASFVYAGTFVQTSTGGGKTTFAISQHVRSSAGTFEGRHVTIYRGVETETGGGAPATTTFDADTDDVASTTRHGQDVELLKSTISSAGTVQTTVSGAGNGVVDQLPEIPQARWTNDATRTVRVNDAFAGSSLADTYRADGSYDEVGVPVQGRQATVQSYPDGNAVYQWPFEGATLNSSIAFSPPSKNNLNMLFVNAAAHVTTLIRIHAWYPSAPLVLAADSVLDAGTVSIPGTCGVPARFGRTATELIENATRLDVVFGEYETTQRTRYVDAHDGLLCLVTSDALQTYYNYQAMAFAGTPLTTTSSSEIIGLRQTSLGASGAESAALPLDARATSWLATQRLQTARAIYDSLRFVRKQR